MFEKEASKLLSKYLGEFIEGLDEEHLKIGVWKGAVNLENLQLKPECVEVLGLPLTVRAGVVGSVSAKFPWTSLKTQPTAITLDKVYLIVGPKTAREFDAEAEQRRAAELKLKRIDEAEEKRLAAASAPVD